MSSVSSDPLVTKLDFDKERTPGPKHYPTQDNYQEPLVQDKLSDREEVQVQSCSHCQKQNTAVGLFPPAECSLKVYTLLGGTDE